MTTDRSRVPLDEAEEAREMEAFFRRQDPVDLAAVDWHTRQEQGLSADEQTALQQWLAASSGHAAAFARMNRSVAALRALSADPANHLRTTSANPDSSARAATASRGNRVEPGSAPRRRGFRAPHAWAALCCLLLLTAGVVWQQWNPQRLFTSHYVVERGQRQTIALPDGSELTLDADTDARITLYQHRRELRLEAGQILLSVAPDADKPFQVLAGPARVTVLGTRFAVRYRQTGASAGAVEVAVEQGLVRVASASGAGPEGVPSGVELTAGQGLTVSATGGLGQTRVMAPGSVAPWLKGLVRFDDTPLGEALQELERYGPTGLQIRDPAVAAMAVGGSFPIGQPQAFARMVAQILPVKLVQAPAGMIEIVRKID